MRLTLQLRKKAAEKAERKRNVKEIRSLVLSAEIDSSMQYRAELEQELQLEHAKVAKEQDAEKQRKQLSRFETYVLTF